MVNDLSKINQKLKEILGHGRGYFGRVFIGQQRPSEYEYIGCESTDDFLLMLKNMSEEQIKNLVKIMNYFEIHAYPLKKLLDSKQDAYSYRFYCEKAWSHFMTVIMFGMLEIAARTPQNVDKNGNLKYKGKNIKKFLEKYLPQETKESITNRYYVESIFNYKKPTDFNEIVDHLWFNIRCGFIHDASIESKGIQWEILEGIGTKEEPITSKSDVPMQEWLRVTWQAILDFYGYKGTLSRGSVNNS
ncbi:hypothetical protein KJ885_01665 [Patescibacteria group bacterium]|nr:hypothetical protein [Patescibacteria group bacterium]